jgi:hypothetical protein
MVRGCSLIDSRLDKAKICSDGRVHVDHAQLPAVFGGEKTFSHGLDPNRTFGRTKRVQSRGKSSQSLDEPIGRHNSDGIRRNRSRVAFDDDREFDQRCYSQEAEDSCDENQLSGFDADIESKQRKRNIPLRQANICQRAGEAKAPS